MKWILRLLLALVLTSRVVVCGQEAAYETRQDERIAQIERKLPELERQAKKRSSDAANTGGVAILFGAFCALWAQNTNRSPWLWFFLGVFFSVITVIVLLVKNADDRFAKKQRQRYTHGRE